MIKRFIFQFLNIFIIISFFALNIPSSYAMEMDGRSNTEQPTGSIAVYQNLARSLVELYDNGYEHGYAETLSDINQLAYEEQFAAFITVLNYTREKNNEFLTKKIYNELNTLFQSHFVDDETKYAQVYSVQCALAAQFPKAFPSNEEIEKEKELAMKVIKGEKRKPEKQKKECETKKEANDAFYAKIRKHLSALKDINTKESFEVLLQSFLHQDAPDEPERQFGLVEYCCKEARKEDPDLAVNFFDYLDEKIYKIYFKGNMEVEAQEYKNRVLDLYLILNNQLSESSSQGFSLTQLQRPYEAEKSIKNTEITVKALHFWWQKNCESQASTIIDDVLFLPTPYTLSCLDMLHKKLLCRYELTQRFPLLITHNEVPDGLPEISKTIIEHPKNPKKMISIVWADKGPLPTKVLLHNGYFIRGYDDGLIKIDGLNQSERNLSFKEDGAITILLARGKHSFISSSGNILKFWDILKKRYKRGCCFDGPIKDIARHKESIYSLIGNAVYSCNNRTQEEPTLLFYEEDSEPTCFSHGNNNTLYVGLANGNMKKIIGDVTLPMKVSRTFEGPIQAIDIKESNMLIQYKDYIVVYS